MEYSKAQIATVDFGFVQVEGLMLPNSSYGISATQTNNFLHFAAHQNYVNRSLKRLLGEDFSPIRVATELNSNKVNVLTIDQFKKLIRELDKQGNPVASAFIDASLDESIERRFDRAFNIKRTEDERNALMELRVKRLLARRKWTDVIQQRNLDLFGVVPTSEQFRDWTVKANLALFNKRHFKCDRDTMTIDEQMIIESFEFLCCRLAKKHPQETPDQILSRVLATF
jgi:hypothetical protein